MNRPDLLFAVVAARFLCVLMLVWCLAFARAAPTGNATNQFDLAILAAEVDDFVLEMDIFVPVGVVGEIVIKGELAAVDEIIGGYRMPLGDPDNTGGIFDQQRGWLYPLTRNTAAENSFQPDSWSRLRIESIGPSLNTWINGQHVARLVDRGYQRGVLALHVSGIEDIEDVAPVVEKSLPMKWKNLRVTRGVTAEETHVSSPVAEISYLNNTLTPWERQQGFRLLWNGKTPTGWRSVNGHTFPSQGWTMDNGILTVAASVPGSPNRPGDIITRKRYQDFELELDFRLTPGANSGIKYYVDTSFIESTGYALGCEYQLLDDERHPDANNGIDGNRTLASLYDLIPAMNSNGTKTVYEPGRWNRARIVANKNRIEHWLNNERVVTYHRQSKAFAGLVNRSKYKDYDGFCQLVAGHILLQDHRNEVSFRNIKIRELN